MNPMIYVNNTLEASELTLLLARLFGKKSIVNDEFGNCLLLREWRKKTYFIDFTPVSHIF